MNKRIKEIEKALLKNGFKKTSTEDNPSLNEWTKNDFGGNDFIMVYLYDVFEIYFDVKSEYTFLTLDELKHYYEKETNLKFEL